MCRSCRCSNDGRIVGIIDESDILAHVEGDGPRAQRFRDPVSHRDDGASCKPCRSSEPLDALPPIFERNEVAIVVDGEKFVGLITRIDLINHLRQHIHDKTRTQNRLAFATRTIHAGQHPDPTTGAVMVPIYATSTYAQE